MRVIFHIVVIASLLPEIFTPFGAVARDDVAGAGDVPPIVLCSPRRRWPRRSAAVAQGCSAADVGADVVPLDHVAGGPAVDDVDAIPSCCPR